MIYPLAETRYRWAGLDRVVDTPEAAFINAFHLSARFV